MREHLTDRLRFLRAFLANPRQVGAILPTSRFAVRDMLDMGDLPAAKLVVELGAGTGVTTREILARLDSTARLVALEIDPDLARLLTERYDDPRLDVVAGSAEDLPSHLAGERADVIVSALPYTSFDRGLRTRVLDALPLSLAPAGKVLVIQYSPAMLGELRKRFAVVRSRISPWNVPPAFLFACSGPRTP